MPAKPKFKSRDAWAIVEHDAIYGYEHSCDSMAIFSTRKGARMEKAFLESYKHDVSIVRVKIEEAGK